MSCLSHKPSGARAALLVFLTAALGFVLTSSARATPLPSSSLGINGGGVTTGIALASAQGVGLDREQIIDRKTNTDKLVGALAAQRLTMYPFLGIPKSNGAVADAAEMTQFVQSFARRYGESGTFWAEHPELPYRPVKRFEIGNEPDIPPNEPADQVSLHYGNPADFALVYAASRQALHAVQSQAVAVVGGMLDSGVPLSEAERYTAALTPGQVDAIGFHPYVYVESRMKEDASAYRAWLDAHGFAGVPLDINEFGTFNTPGSSADWGRLVADYSIWALCSPAMHVENVQAFWWGATPATDKNPWMAMVSSELQLTPFGQEYLAQAHALTTGGCPAPSVKSVPAIKGTPRLGTTLRASAAAVSCPADPTIGYQWQRWALVRPPFRRAWQGWVSIAGAGARSYTLTRADVGHVVRLLATASVTGNQSTVPSTPSATIIAPPKHTMRAPRRSPRAKHVRAQRESAARP